MASISVVIPAHNESNAIVETVKSVERAFEESGHECEVIVIDDGSSDDTRHLAEEAGARVISHPMNIGYGNAILTGVRNARHPWIGIADADGTYPIHELPRLLGEAESRKLDMLIGARQGRHYRGGPFKWGARIAFTALSEFAVGQRIPDINSGLRVMRREMVQRFAPVLSGGFSFTTTITIIGFLTQHFVDYTPIEYLERKGTSHVRYLRDTLRAAQIIVMTILFFNPIKLFLVQCIAVVVVGFIATILSFFTPSLGIPLLIGFSTYLFLHILIGLGFLAEQRRVYLANVTMRERGYSADDNPYEESDRL